MNIFEENAHVFSECISIGDERFVWIDTAEKKWGFAEG